MPRKGILMPRYYFDLRYGDLPWFEDKKGDRLTGLDEARSEAREILADAARDHLRDHSQIAVRVRDDQPTPLLVLRLSISVEERSDG